MGMAGSNDLSGDPFSMDKGVGVTVFWIGEDVALGLRFIPIVGRGVISALTEG